MKTIICGGRNAHLSEEDKEYLKTLGITQVMSGGAAGIDQDAIEWAKENNIPYVIFNAKWGDLLIPGAKIKINKFGKKYNVLAGFQRNEEMAKNAEACVAFAGGNGTKHMWETAKKYGLKRFSLVFSE